MAALVQPAQLPRAAHRDHDPPAATTAPANAGPVTPPVTPPPGNLSDDWQHVSDEVDPTARALMVELAQAQFPLPDIGEEMSGIPIEISWPRHKVAVDYRPQFR